MRMSPPFTMIGSGVYKIRESKDPDFPQGGTVVANIGWVKTGTFDQFSSLYHTA